MLAYRVMAWGHAPILTSVPEPVPRAGEVLVAVTASGVCHSDLHVVDGPARDWQLPFTLGHEVTGVVADVGNDEVGIAVGDPVAVYGPWGCGECRSCRAGAENICLTSAPGSATGGGLGRDGGMAEYMVVPSARLLVPCHGLDLVSTAPLLDAGLTPYHAIARLQPALQDGSRCLVIGVGGLGHLAVQILLATTNASIVAVESNAERLAHVDGRVDSALPFHSVETLIDQLGQHSFDAVIDTVATGETLHAAGRMIAPGGYIAILGRASERHIRFIDLPQDVSVVSSFWGSRNELRDLLDLARDGHVTARTCRYSLENVEQAYQDLRMGRFDGRIVIEPGRTGDARRS